MSDASPQASRSYAYDSTVGAEYFIIGNVRIYIEPSTGDYFQFSNGIPVYTDHRTRETYTLSANGSRIPFDRTPRSAPQSRPSVPAAPYHRIAPRPAISTYSTSPSQNPGRSPPSFTKARYPEPIVGSVDSGYGTSYPSASNGKTSTKQSAPSETPGKTTGIESDLGRLDLSAKVDRPENNFTQRTTKIPGVLEIVIQDGHNRVHSTYCVGPPGDGTTSKEAWQKGIGSSKFIKGTEGGSKDRVDPSYKVRSRKAQPLRVLDVIETLEADPPAPLRGYLTTVTFSPQYSQQHGVSPRKWIVIEDSSDSCTVLPIRTYFGRGVGYPGVVKSNHVMVYSYDSRFSPPEPRESERPQQGENGMKPYKIAVDMAENGNVLNQMSRVDLARPVRISHEKPMKHIGRVRRESEWALRYTFLLVQLENLPANDRRRPAIASQYQSVLQNATANNPASRADSATTYLYSSGWTNQRHRAINVGHDKEDESEGEDSESDGDDE